MSTLLQNIAVREAAPVVWCVGGRSFVGLVGAQVLRVVYSDESGTGDESQPITVVTAVLMNLDSQWFPLSAALSKAIGNIPKKLLKGPTRELKGSELFKGIRGKVRGVSKRDAGMALKEVLLAASDCRIQIFYGAIDRKGYAAFLENFEVEQRQTGQEAAFDECLKRLDGYINLAFPNERVLWIADRTGYEKSMKSGLRFFQFLQTVNANSLLRLSGGNLAGLALRDPQPSHVVDTIYFGDSHESLALQFADVCCSTVAEHLLDTQEGNAFYRIIRQQVVTDGTPIVYSEAWGGANVRPKR